MSAIHGLLLQVNGPEQLVDAAKQANANGITPLDAFSPFPVEDLTEALGLPPSRLPWLMLACGVSGAVIAFGTITFAEVVHFPFNVGGRPHFSWPPMVPIMFELMVLFAALGGAFALAVLSELPRLHHPVFNDRRFREAAQAGFFLLLPDCAAARDFLNARYPDAWKEVEE